MHGDAGVRRVGHNTIVGPVPGDPERDEMKARAFVSPAGWMKWRRTDGTTTTTAGDMAANGAICGRDRQRPIAPLLAAVVACCWLLIGQCAGQRPINLGSSKKRDVYIAGFFPYGNHVPEGHIGRGVMPAVKLAVEHINEHPTILRDHRLHMWWNDTEVRFPAGTMSRCLLRLSPPTVRPP